MAEPKLEIDRRMDRIEEAMNTMTKAINTMVSRLVEAQTDFSMEMNRILSGEDSENDGAR